MKAKFNQLLSPLVLIIFLSGASAYAIEKQKAENWCWAACVQNLLFQRGAYVPQEQVAARLDGWPRDRPAHVNELVVLLQTYGFRSWLVGRPGSPQELYNSFTSGWKMVAFVRPSNGHVGHFIVLQDLAPNRNILVYDPINGFAFPVRLQSLYNQYKWEASIIVGLPQY